MALKNSQYYSIMREYEQRQLRNHDIQTARYEEVYKKLPEFKSLDESISILSVQYGKKLLNGDDHALASLKEELEILRSSKKNLLVSAGFPEDYLEPVYDCPDCKDTGYIGNQKCHCFKKAVIKLLYEESNIREFPTEASFENFSLDFYSSSLYDKTTGRSARAMMEDTLKICRRFIDGRKHRRLLILQISHRKDIRQKFRHFAHRQIVVLRQGRRCFAFLRWFAFLCCILFLRFHRQGNCELLRRWRIQCA